MQEHGGAWSSMETHGAVTSVVTSVAVGDGLALAAAGRHGLLDLNAMPIT